MRKGLGVGFWNENHQGCCIQLRDSEDHFATNCSKADITPRTAYLGPENKTVFKFGIYQDLHIYGLHPRPLLIIFFPPKMSGLGKHIHFPF